MNYICFDIGGTKIKHGILDDNYKIIEQNQIDTSAHLGGMYIVNEVIKLINNYKLKYNCLGVAISTAGVVDYTDGSIKYANELIPNYTGLKVASTIYKETNLKASLENDVNCFALSHVLNTFDDFLMVAIGTGIGGAIVIDKEIYHGTTNSAGEFGQMLINSKKFESLASVSSLVKVAVKLGLDVNSGIEVFKLYDEGNLKAISAVNYFYKNLAIGLANLAYIFNFPKIILGGGIANRPSFLNELIVEVEKIADPAYFNTLIEVSPNTNNGGLIGALVNYKNKYTTT